MPGTLPCRYCVAAADSESGRIPEDRRTVILIIDNYDSFTYNLVQRVGELRAGLPIEVVRNDAHGLDGLAAMNPSHLIISPGPGDPDDAGVSMDAIRYFAGKVPVLGVCLGHQCIGQVYGGRIIRAGRLMHGKTSPIQHDGKGLFFGLSNPFTATRYHSLVVDAVPAELERTAWTDRGELMGLRHKTLAVEGVQFHPESFLTEEGPRLLANFIQGQPARA
jgi:anthranilate synthase/aminodeoxychorismate synthase-like glutamine amidotransferase